MKRFPLLITAAGTLTLAACGPAQVVVTAEIQVEDPATGEMVTRQLSDLEVELLPYDRDLIFDSLAKAAATPEPQIPQELSDAQDSIAVAQQTWRDLENRWNTLRDTLQKISDAMEQYSPAEATYAVLYRDFGDMEGQYNRVEREKDAAFARFDSLSQANIERTQAFSLHYDEWANEAFADVDAVMLAHQREAGLTAVADTTDASGVATFEVRPGAYWVYARYAEPYTELYWNLPVTAQRGDPATVTLNRAEAKERPNM